VIHGRLLLAGELGGRVDERDVRESLWEVPDQAARHRVVLLGQQTEVVADETGPATRHEVPFDVPEADAAEQERAVGFDDDDYR